MITLTIDDLNAILNAVGHAKANGYGDSARGICLHGDINFYLPEKEMKTFDPEAKPEEAKISRVTLDQYGKVIIEVNK